MALSQRCYSIILYLRFITELENFVPCVKNGTRDDGKVECSFTTGQRGIFEALSFLLLYRTDFCRALYMLCATAFHRCDDVVVRHRRLFWQTTSKPIASSKLCLHFCTLCLLVDDLYDAFYSTYKTGLQASQQLCDLHLIKDEKKRKKN
ncbi:hypothetical protein T09_13215 [Trichinella sp. T9]|nr:hypothetical protein T09_13215 [Trichinella sp. T9]